MSIDKKQKLSTFNRFVFEMLLPSIIMTIILIFMIRGNKKTGKYADVNGIKMYYEIYGSGKPLLFVHGNGGSIESGKDQISFFSKNHKVIAADSRGQGKTIDTGDSLTYDQLAADINALL
ncbi:MAG TPA: alpha/beta hydrolase, partial [Chitinophagaceae bacterium]|nr:alpha/beta hydrolase [Chitinophagaceae bacterium]